MLRTCDVQGGQEKIKSRVGPKKRQKIQGGSEKRTKNPRRVHKIDRKSRVGLEKKAKNPGRVQKIDRKSRVVIFPKWTSST